MLLNLGDNSSTDTTFRPPPSSGDVAGDAADADLYLPLWQKLMLASLLQLAHWSVSLFLACHLHLRALYRRLAGYFRSPASRRRIEDSYRRLVKKPAHVALAFLEDKADLSLPDVARLLFWCFEADVAFVSLYDVHGRVRRCRPELMRAMARAKEAGSWAGVGGQAAEMDLLRDVTWHGGSDEAEVANGNGNGTVPDKGPRRRRHINLVSAAAGLPDIVGAARRIAGRVQAGSLSAGDIDEATVDESLTPRRENLPDPDLLVQIGTADATAGFLPWQLRLTEMHRMETHKNVQFEEFLDVLLKYSKCEQRVGK